MKVATLVFVINAACVSPHDTHVASTEIYKVPCAGVRYDIVANPYKVAQEPNVPLTGPTLADGSAKAAQPPRYEYSKAKKKKLGRCGSKRQVTYWKNGWKKWRCR